MFHGSMVALITPYQGANLDESALRSIIQFNLEQGTHAIIAAGTTGEASTLSKTEYKRVIKISVQETAGQIPVIAGAG